MDANQILVKFKDYLKASLTKGSSAPPVSIKAQDLDDNFAAATLIQNKATTDKIYKVIYAREGTSLEFISGDKKVTWQELDICVNGVGKKIKVLATEPYSS